HGQNHDELSPLNNAVQAFFAVGVNDDVFTHSRPWIAVGKTGRNGLESGGGTGVFNAHEADPILFRSC
ncbi:hypothetical protein AD936_00300, partial [Gluconobacter japonicus]